MTRPDPNDIPGGSAQGAFEELGRISFAEHSLESLIQTVTDLAARVIPVDPATSVTIVSQGTPRTVAWSDERAAELDRVQYSLGGGPCLTAAGEGRTAEVLDTRTEQRWPEFAQRASELGFQSVLSVPLPVQERVSGGLNVYARRSHGADERNRELATRFASYAVVPVSNMYLYTSAVERVGHLEAALDSRAVIDQAKGILMERYRLTADQAFQALARMSMETNTKVRDVAERMVETGTCGRADSRAEAGLQVLPRRHPDGAQAALGRLLPLDLDHLTRPERLRSGAAADDVRLHPALPRQVRRLDEPAPLRLVPPDDGAEARAAARHAPRLARPKRSDKPSGGACSSGREGRERPWLTPLEITEWPTPGARRSPRWCSGHGTCSSSRPTPLTWTGRPGCPAGGRRRSACTWACGRRTRPWPT